LAIIISLVYFLVFSLSSVCIGGALLRRLGFSNDLLTSARGKIGIELTLGMGLWGLIYLPLSAIDGLWTIFGKAVFIALIVLAIAKWHRHIEDVTEAYRHWKTQRSESGRGISMHYIFSILIALLFLLTFLNACGPISSWDELVDHLPRAKFIAYNGVFVDDPSTPFSGYPALCELLFAPLTSLADELTAITVFTFAIALLLMITGFSRTFLPPGWANPAAIILFTMPLMADLMHTALVDVPLAAFCFAVFYLVAMALTNEGGDKCNPVRCFFIAGVFLGFAMSVKYNGLLAAAAWFIVLFITLLFKRVGLWRLIGWMLMLFIPAIVVCGGWYARNFLLYNNPVYPFFNELFAGGTAISIDAFTRPEMGHTWVDLLLYPIRLTYDYDLIRHWYRAITPAFLCFIPLGLILKRGNKFSPVFTLALWLGLVHIFLACNMSPGHTRYLLPLWAIWAPLAAFGMARASAGSKFLRGFLVPVILIIPLLLMLAMQGKHFVELMPYFTGRISKVDVIAKDMPSVKFQESFKDFIRPDGKILSIEPRVYYIPRDAVIGTPGIEAPDAPRWDIENTVALAAELQYRGYTHLFIDFSSRQLKHAMGMDFFLENIPNGTEGRYFSYDGVIELMENKYHFAQYFSREDLYALSAIGGFDIYLDESGRDWHWVERATIEERSQYTKNLQFIRHFWMMENSILKEVSREGTAVLYEIDYNQMRALRSIQDKRDKGRYTGGRLHDLTRNPQLTPEIQNTDESKLTFYKEQDSEGMI